jgi:hypothetical protein
MSLAKQGKRIKFNARFSTAHRASVGRGERANKFAWVCPYKTPMTLIDLNGNFDAITLLAA